MDTALLGIISHILIVFVLVVRVLTRPHREPASRIAWVAVIGALPVIGIVAYLLLGETTIGYRRTLRMNKAVSTASALLNNPNDRRTDGIESIPEPYNHIFRLGKSINNLNVVDGNAASLLPDSNTSINAMVADIDAATHHVHLAIYIWLADNNGLKMVAALKRAAARGVQCKVLADDIGSRKLIRSRHWRAMRDSGVSVARALPIKNPLIWAFFERIDLRNHRKILVIDNRITYCGSQNLADPEFLIRKRYAPWIDMMVRFEGPIARQNQYIFAIDWMSHTDENITPLLDTPVSASRHGYPAQVIGTGPTIRNSAMPEIFSSLFYTARKELLITTPYYVPNEAMQSALCSAARRGVKTILILPARNDSWSVAGASRSYYKDLIESGVMIYEYTGGLLHTKSLTVDGRISLIGSANMDRRSFELNYENNILVYSAELTADIRSRQQAYITQSNRITIDIVHSWPLITRLWNNSLAMIGPIL